MQQLFKDDTRKPHSSYGLNKNPNSTIPTSLPPKTNNNTKHIKFVHPLQVQKIQNNNNNNNDINNKSAKVITRNFNQNYQNDNKLHNSNNRVSKKDFIHNINQNQKIQYSIINPFGENYNKYNSTNYQNFTKLIKSYPDNNNQQFAPPFIAKNNFNVFPQTNNIEIFQSIDRSEKNVRKHTNKIENFLINANSNNNQENYNSTNYKFGDNQLQGTQSQFFRSNYVFKMPKELRSSYDNKTYNSNKEPNVMNSKDIRFGDKKVIFSIILL